jgi:hypothetical protein
VDTRRKIIAAADAGRLIQDLQKVGAPWLVVAGYFDPVIGSHVRRIEEIARNCETLVVSLLTPSRELLPAGARAELAAALAPVDYVVLPDAEAASGGMPLWLSDVPAEHLIREEQADLERRDDLIQLIHRKSALGAA